MLLRMYLLRCKLQFIRIRKVVITMAINIVERSPYLRPIDILKTCLLIVAK